MVNPKNLSPHHLLTPLQLAVLHVFTQIPDHNNFFLTGGTALSEFYLGHRLSYDLDLFTSEDGLIQPVSYQVERLVAENNLKLEVIRRFTTYVEFLISDDNESLKVDLALDSPFRFQPPLFTPLGIWVNNFVDLCVDKLLAYYGRAEPRDAVDLFLILEYQTLEALVEKAKQKDPGFDLYWFAVALNRSGNFPNESEHWPVKMLQEWDPKQIKRLFYNLAVEIMENL